MMLLHKFALEQFVVKLLQLSLLVEGLFSLLFFHFLERLLLLLIRNQLLDQLLMILLVLAHWLLKSPVNHLNFALLLVSKRGVIALVQFRLNQRIRTRALQDLSDFA